MSQFVVLSSDNHRRLKLKKNVLIAYAAKQQALPIEAVGVVKAAVNFPVFFTKNQHDEMTLSAIASLTPDTSLFVKAGKWDSSYVPSCLQTYPFYLIRSPDDETQFTVGIEEDNPSFSETEGGSLFTEDGKASQQLEHITRILKSEMSAIQATVKMVDTLQGLGLFKPLELVLKYQDNSAKKINGLYTVDEEKLTQLSADELAELNRSGFLVVIHALLISVYQINNLMRRHNESTENDKIAHIKIELPEVSN
jgi:hypothetical protein